MTSSMLASDRELVRESALCIADGGSDSTYPVGPEHIRYLFDLCTGASVSLSHSGKAWKFPPEIQVDDGLLEAAGGSLLLARLLVRRGIRTAAEAKSFLDPHCYEPANPMELPDMARAIARISQAVAQGEHITVYGDYDVDGVTGTAVFISVLRELGADVDYYIPNRTGEGYGLNLKAVSILASKRRTKLIITCDCGVSNFAEINFAKSLGVDTIVTDHHTMPEMLPPAVAVIHPKLLPEDHPLYNLPGVGVAYKLCEALLTDRGKSEQSEALLDLVTLGMIADLVPLVKENRYLVQIGLGKLAATVRPGLQALLSQVKSGGGTDVVGFGIAPRINAVGRLSDANRAVELLTTGCPARAETIARELQTENARRQELCEKIMTEADRLVSSRFDPASDMAIAIYDEGWHHGVVGIVASRLVEKYHRPVFIGQLEREEGIVKGSARGVEGIDLYEALKANEHLLARWGGHKMAAGFSVEIDKATAFCEAIKDTCKRLLGEKSLRPVLEVDAVVETADVSMSLVSLLSKLAPFGMANRKPMLVAKGLRCAEVRVLGKEGKHNRVMLQDAETGALFECVMWNSKGKAPAEGQVLDAAFHAEINSFNGRDRLQLVLVDWQDPARETTVLPERAGFQAEPSKAYSGADAGVPPAPPGVSLPKTVTPGVAAAPSVVVSKGQPGPLLAASSMTWKDLRDHLSPAALLEAARRKLGQRLAVFSESASRNAAAGFVDRTGVEGAGHLMLWHYPPSAEVFRSLILKSGASHIYLVRPPDPEVEEPASGYLKRLLGLVRYAVNKKEGKAEAERLESAMGTTTMAMALALTIFRKLNLVEWFCEDGWLYLDLIEQGSGSPEDLAEFRQLGGCLREIHQFRAWCAQAGLEEIQLAVTPNDIDFNPGPAGSSRRDDRYEFQDGASFGQAEPVHPASTN